MRALLRRGHCIENSEPLFLGLISRPLEVHGPFSFSFGPSLSPTRMPGSARMPGCPLSLPLAKARMSAGGAEHCSVVHHSLGFVSLKSMFIFWLWVRSWYLTYLNDWPSRWAGPATEYPDQTLEYSGHSLTVCWKSKGVNFTSHLNQGITGL